MRVIVINGVNLNVLGSREPSLYGNKSYKQLVAFIRAQAKRLGVNVKCVQSNYEGKLVEIIQSARDKYDGIIINAGAYSHTSVALLDALKYADLPTVEVHITDIQARESFRNISYISLYAEKMICGKGFDGYKLALKYLIENT